MDKLESIEMLNKGIELIRQGELEITNSTNGLNKIESIFFKEISGKLLTIIENMDDFCEAHVL